MRHSRVLSAFLIAMMGGMVLEASAQTPGELLRRGSALMRAGHAAEAEEALKSIGEKDADYPAAQTLLGYALLRRSALDEAAAAFRRVLDADPKDPNARFGLGITLSRGGNLEDAAEQFTLVFTDPVLEAKARAQWIQVLFWMGKEEQALSEASRLSLDCPSVPEYHSLEGYLLQVKGDSEAAMHAFERALQLDSSRMTDYFGLIAVCRSRKDWQAALRWSLQALQLDPNQPVLYEELAQIYMRLDLPEKSEEARAEAKSTLAAEMLYARSAKARAEGRTLESEKFLHESLQVNPNLSKAWSDLGEIERGKNHLTEALQAFRRALELDPANRLASLGAAAALHERAEESGKPDGAALPEDPDDSRSAASILLRALRDFPDNADLLAGLGRVQESGAGPGEALRSYSAALAIDPLMVQAIVGKADYLLASGEAALASSEFRRATEIQPSNMQAWRGLVRAYREKKDYGAAESACRECLAHNPGNTDCLVQLAFLKHDRADFRASVQLFETVIRNGKASKDILDSLAFGHMKLGDSSEATGLFESSLKRYGPDPWIDRNLGYLYQNRGNLRLAIANYRRACAQSPQDAEINHNLGFALYLAKDYAAALEPFKTALKLRPDWGLAHFNLAMNYWNLRQYAPALMHARIAEEKGQPGATRVVQALTANLSLGAPRTVTVSKPKK